ncbi:MAG: hypothetical protein Unbinned5081contig1002_15 [Prokaryotic dsDNA virus sp.]|nr:MAG: hypothetical protein Unbinned5081contig1002_15 [Prokaryotic dsDNA virus sp.]|tara:strand:+ start:3455 stop:3670 length:216 start_codon:yes stop_codon:yes gene_type:complete
MINKILRTTIGLPFVLVVWLPFGFFVLLVTMFIVLYKYINDGNFKNIKFTNKWWSIVLMPYEFLRKVWIDE